MSKEKNNNEYILQSSFFLKLFCIPTLVWIILSLIGMIGDDADPDPLTWGELIIGDIVILLIWFVVSFVLTLIFNEIKKSNSKTKVIKEIHYVEADKKIEGTNDKDIAMKYHNYNFIRIGMIILFVITILSLWGSLISAAILDYLKPQHGFNFIKNMWILWCWLPIPILSIILGFKFNSKGFKCTKNIVAGFIIGFLLLIYGSFCLVPTFSEDYSKIDKYRDIIDAEIPNNGEIEIQDWGTYFDEDKTEYTVINTYYDKENVNKLVNSIENNDNWILSTEIESTLKIFIPSQLHSDKDAYFSIYNKTTNQYNTLPGIAGDYEIYAMKYDKSDKHLEIHKFKYSYK